MRLTLDPFRLLQISLASCWNQPQRDVIDYRRPHRSYSPIVCEGICSLLSLQAAAARIVLPLLRIRPGKSATHHLARRLCWILAWMGVSHSQSSVAAGPTDQSLAIQLSCEPPYGLKPLDVRIPLNCWESRPCVRSKCVDKGGHKLAKSASFLVRSFFDDTQLYTLVAHDAKMEILDRITEDRRFEL